MINLKLIGLTAIGIALLNSGCGGGSSDAGGNNPFTTSNPNNEPIFSTTTTVTTESADNQSIGSTDVTTGSTNTPPLPTDSFLIGTEILGQMNRYQPNSGAVARFSDLRSVGSYEEYDGSVDVANNSIISAATDNSLNVLDIDSGDLLWDIFLGPKRSDVIDAPTPPVCTENICYAMGVQGHLYAVDIGKEEAIWSNSLFPGEEDALSLFNLLVTEDRIFAGGFRDSTVYGDVDPALYVVSRESGEIISELPAGNLAVAGDLLLISGDGLQAYNLETLQPVWFADLDFVSRAAVVGDVVVVHAADPNVAEIVGQRVKGLNRLDGSTLWTVDAGTMQSPFVPTTDGRLIYTAYAEQCRHWPCASGNPMALNPADGSIIWKNEEIDLQQTVSAVVVGGKLLYNDAFGPGFIRGAASLNAVDGSINWVSMEGQSHYSLTAIVNGVAFRNSTVPTFIAD